MSSDSDNESIEGDVNQVGKQTDADWGKAKRDYYYTDYVDKDYPSKLSAKEERLASLEQEEALRIQKKLLSTLDNVNLQPIFLTNLDEEEELSKVDINSKQKEINLLDFIETQNKNIDLEYKSKLNSRKRKRVVFKEELNDEDSSDDEDDDDEEGDDDEEEDAEPREDPNSRRRPINIAMKKNRGLTPYKKKEYRNPRVKHKNKYKKAMSKRRKLVKEAKIEYHRYSGEANGIKTSTIRSIKLC